MDLVHQIFKGTISFMSVFASPLYRYPYRNSGEALRGDWLKLGKDIESSIDKLGENE